MTSAVEAVKDDTPGLHLFAQLGLSIDSLAGQIKAANSREQRRLANLPTYQSLERMSAPGTNTFDVVDFGSPQPGRTWIVRLLGAIASPDTLISGTLTTPTSNHPANPAAGADFTVTVPVGQAWQLQSVTFTLVTSATVANRVVNVIIDDGVNTVFQWVSPVAQTAGQTVTYTGYNGAPNAAAVSGGVLTFNLPNILLGAGWRVRTSTTAIQAGDQYSAIDVSYIATSGAPKVTWYVGQNVPGFASGQLPPTNARWQFGIPGFQTFTSNVIQLVPQQHLLAGITGLAANSFTSLMCGFNEQPLYQQSAAVAVE